MNNFTEHVERFLGRLEHGWTKSYDGTPLPFQVAEFRNGMIDGSTAFLTLGLSRTGLPSPVSQKLIYQELLSLVRTNDSEIGVPSLLQQLGSEALNRRTAYLRGEVIGPRGTIFEGTNFEAIYVTIPTYYPESFSIFEEDNGCKKVIAWLIPITLSESKFVQSQGWSKFEDLLESKDPDLLDLNRRSVV